MNNEMSRTGSSRILRPERLQRILELVATEGNVTVAQLTELFQVSGTSIRRDLNELVRQGKAKRVHGGVVGSPKAVDEWSFQERLRAHHEEKIRIGQVAAGLIRDNSTLFLDSGTTTLEVARHIGPMNHLFVVTDSLAVMRELGPRPGVTATLVGGLYNHSSVSTGGPLAVANLRQFHGDLLILGVDGVDIAHGLTGNQPLEVESLRTMIERVDSVVLVADSSKIGRVAFTQIAPLTAADTFVTDRGADPCTLAAFREAGIDVLVA